MKEREVLNVGIDLGTSRTAIACDNGVRTFFPTYVGYPKDTVSHKMLEGKDIVFGEEALKYRMALELYRPIEKGMIKYYDNNKKTGELKKTIEVTRQLLKKLISLAVKDEPQDLFIRGVIGAPAMASIKNRKVLLEVAKGILDEIMIASEPFAVAYGLDMLNNFLIIDIGAGTVDICRMHGTIPNEEDQITTYKAGDYIDQVFLDLVKKKYKDANFTVTMIKRFKEENAFVSKQGEQISITLPVKGKPVSHDVTDELRAACRAIVPDIVEGIRKLVATYDPEFQDELKRNIVLAGGGSQIIGLKNEIETYMKNTLGYGKVTKVEEPLYAGANGALMLSKDMPDEYWDELKSQPIKKKPPKGVKDK